MQKEVVKVGNHEVTEIMWNGERVITTAQLAEVYETNVKNVQMNFSNSKNRFEEGKHFFLLKDDELRGFKNWVNDIGLVDKHTPLLYLWTHRGASRHCKILDTEKAWEQFDNLEEAYFNPKPAQQTTVTYQYPISAATFEGVANFGRLIERTMKSEGSCPHEIASVLDSICLQAGIELPKCFVKIPAYEQMTLDIITR